MKKWKIRPLCKLSRAVLHIELPLTLLVAVVFLISYLQARESDLGYALYYYPPLVGYLLYPPVITVFSVLLIERLQLDHISI